ncbi:MAG: hypothetical protein AUK52_03985 [Comamonadaceae bacterium CG2_30_60_41]|nr:MAG: hypothetical protein AUK52_03985 [Comamonadaceae bacterium CG2_30_60_41]
MIFMQSDIRNQTHIITRHQFLNIKQYQHTITQGPKSNNRFRINNTFDIWCCSDLIDIQSHHITYRIDNNTYNPLMQIKNNHYRKRIIIYNRAIELQTHINNWNNRSSKIDYTFDKRWCICDACRWFVATNFLNLEYVNTIFFCTNPKR